MNKTAKIIIAVIILAVYLISMLGMASALTISSVSTSPSEVAPGEKIDVMIRIENDGSEDLIDVSISLDLTNSPFAPYDSSSEQSFDEILEDKSKQAEFSLVALNNANSGIYKIPIRIEYTEDTSNAQPKIKTGLISLTINSVPIVDVQTAESTLIKGGEGKLNIKIVNKGLSDIKFLEVKIEKSGAFSLTSPDKVYIGDLDANDFDTAEFDAFFKEDSSTNLKIPITITYRDIFNKEYIEEQNILVKVYSKQDAIKLGLITQNNTGYYLVGAVVLIIIWIIYRRVKKRKKKMEESER